MPQVKLADLEEALEWGSSGDGNAAYISKDTGRIFWVSEQGNLEEEPPEDLYESDEYIEIPDKRDLDLGTGLVFEFTRRELPHHYDEVRASFRHSGAYARYKSLLAGCDLLERWHEFSDAEQ